MVAGTLRRKTVERTTFFSVALVSIGLMPYAIWTDDRAHVGATAVSLFVTPAAAAALVDLFRPFSRQVVLL